MIINVSEIRSDVPMPGVVYAKSGSYGDFREETNGRPKELLRYQIEHLQIGECVVAQNTGGIDLKKFYWRIHSIAQNASKSAKIKTMVRKTGENEMTIWRKK